MTYSIAVVCRQKAFDETRRKLGWWSYAVPDLIWRFYSVEDGQTVNKDDIARAGHDLIVWEDWVWPQWEGKSSIPIYAVIVDSNTSTRRRKRYQTRQGVDADVLLIDQDQLKTFAETGKPVYRWQGCVNEQVFAPREKVVDMAYHVSKTPERGELYEYLRAWIADKPYSMTAGAGLTIDQYAVRIGQAKIVIHKRTHEQCRSHRYFDALATGACLLAEQGWQVPEDGFLPGVHYLTWENPADLVTALEWSLEGGHWLKYAQAGQAFVLARHTWRQRAAELVRIIEKNHAKA